MAEKVEDTLKVLSLDDDKEKLSATKKTYSGIPEAEFVEDVDAFMAKPENAGGADKVLKNLDEQHSKYKFMEYNLVTRKRRLRNQIPDLSRSLDVIRKLKSQKRDMPTEFLLSEQVFVKALIPPTDSVCLWLGANVMLEYPLKDAEDLLTQNEVVAHKNYRHLEHDIDFLRDQITTTEVNMARVYNWDVKKRQAAKTP